MELPRLIGMVHLAPLPGAPGWTRGRAWLERAREDARTLAEAGFDAVMVENHGDTPFFKDDVPDVTVAAMTSACVAAREVVPAGIAVGVNVLRNDARAALAIAAAADLQFVRVNVLSGAAVTDQGIIEGRAAEVVRDRGRWARGVRILADVRVKHSAPLAARPLAEEVADLVGRGGADAVIASGAGTGRATDPEHLREVVAAARRTPVYVGSGATPATVAALLEAAHGVVVGTALKRGGRPSGRVDAARARAFVAAATA